MKECERKSAGSKITFAYTYVAQPLFLCPKTKTLILRALFDQLIELVMKNLKELVVDLKAAGYIKSQIHGIAVD